VFQVSSPGLTRPSALIPLHCHRDPTLTIQKYKHLTMDMPALDERGYFHNRED
jgi:hypothetical protein